MNFFTQDIQQGLLAMMNGNRWNSGSEKQNNLRSNLQKCTYADETKYVIEKAVKQLLHVYPFFNPDLLMFTEGGIPKRYIQLKGILEMEIKGKICKIDYNMMLPADYPRSAPFVRIVNRNLDYRVDPFYQSVQSKTDASSYILNQKLSGVKNWQPSNSLVNIVLESNELLKNRFPFSKPITQNNTYGSNNAWDALYSNKNSNNYGGGGFSNGSNGGNGNNYGDWGNNNWGGNLNSNNWGGNNNNTWNNNQLGNNSGWNANNNANNNGGWGQNPSTNPANTYNNNGNNWGNSNQGGMSGIISGGGSINTIASSQKLVGKQKINIQKIQTQFTKVLEKNQHLDIIKQSLSSEESYLRTQNYEMANFLKLNENADASNLANIVQPRDNLSEQILNLTCSLKSREDCITFLQNRFSQQQLSFEDFLKQLRKIEENRFEQKCLLEKCLKQTN